MLRRACYAVLAVVCAWHASSARDSVVEIAIYRSAVRRGGDTLNFIPLRRSPIESCCAEPDNNRPLAKYIDR